MAKKKRTYLKNDTSVFRMSAEDATLSKMPKYNAYAGGYGAHGKNKYDRNKEKRDFKKDIDENR